MENAFGGRNARGKTPNEMRYRRRARIKTSNREQFEKVFFWNTAMYAHTTALLADALHYTAIAGAGTGDILSFSILV